MAKTVKSDKDQVEVYLNSLNPAVKKQVQTIREIVLAADKQIAERIKWNNLSFYYAGEMKPFDPKEYKSDIAVFNLHKGKMMLVLPSGAKIKKGTSILEGDYKDGRRLINFDDLDDINSKKKELVLAIKDWIGQIE